MRGLFCEWCVGHHLGHHGHLCWRISYNRLKSETLEIMLQAVCWQDYPPDCCSAAYTTVIITRYLIHFSRDLKYLGAAPTPMMHLPHSSTDLMRLYHHFTERSTNPSWFSRLYYTFFTSFQMIMDLRVLHLPWPPLPRSVCSQHCFCSHRGKSCWMEVALRQPGAVNESKRL